MYVCLLLITCMCYFLLCVYTNMCTCGLHGQPCDGTSRTQMECNAPAINASLPAVLAIGLLMDGACHLLNVNTSVLVLPDPDFFPLDDTLVISVPIAGPMDVAIEVRIPV